MPSKAFVTLVGHSGKDYELKYAQSGTAIGSFSLATNKWRGEGKEETVSWWNITVFGKRAEGLNERGPRKGDLVMVRGECYLDDWTGQDGEKHASLKVDASDVMVFGKRADSTDASAASAPAEDYSTIPF